MTEGPTPPIGVREQKRRETHRRITEAGLKLFSEAGYDATTLDDIARASGIARRTFFHYFRSKDDIILAWQNALPDGLHRLILAQKGAATPVVAIQSAMTSLADEMRPEAAAMIGRIVQSTEHLRLGNQTKFLQMESAAFDALATLWPQPDRQDGLRLVAMIGVGVMRLAVDAWIAEEGRQPLATHLGTAFERLRSEVDALKLQTLII